MKERINIGNNAFILPEPQTIVGSILDGQPNFMALAWITRVNYKPCIMSIAVNQGHATNRAIKATGQFSVNLPSQDMVEVTDYVGLASGNRTDKSTLFDVHYGALKDAPLIRDCPLSMELEVIQTLELETNTVFFGEVKGAWTEEQYMTDGYVDVEKVRPMTLTMPDNRYWAMGNNVGRAWHDGKVLKEKLKTQG